MILYIFIGISIALIAIVLSRNEKPALSHLDTLTWTGFAAGIAGTSCSMIIDSPPDVASIIGVSVAAAGALVVVLVIEPRR